MDPVLRYDRLSADIHLATGEDARKPGQRSLPTRSNGKNASSAWNFAPLATPSADYPDVEL